MPEPPSKTQRLLDLVAFLLKRRFPVTVEEIMQGVPGYAKNWWAGGDDEGGTDRDSVRRMFERDKDELRELGVPIESVTDPGESDPERAHGYLLRKHDFYLPYLKPPGEAAAPDAFELPRHEAAAALRGLEQVSDLPGFPLLADARSAFRKLTFDLDPDRFLPPATRYLEPPGAPDPADALAELSDALLRRKEVTFAYQGIARDERTERTVAPYGLFFENSRWFLVGHDALRDDIRTFRVSRMEDLEVNSRRAQTADYEVPEGFDLERHARREAWELGSDAAEPHHARVLFRFPRSLWADRNDYGELVEELDDGSQVRAFRFHREGPFLRWLLKQEGEAVVQLPAELRLELGKLAERVAEAHGEEPIS